MKASRLVLGTAQLGMKYGLNNSCGQPDKDAALAILDEALAAGLSTFDTAYAYGTAEDVLGEWIEARKIKGTVSVISKMRADAINDYPDGTKASDIVRTEIEKSLRRLRLECLDGYLLHAPHHIYLAHVVEALQNVKAEGLARRVGVSIYDEAEALKAAELKMDYIQIPYNVLDRRIDRTAFFDIARTNDVTVFARSPLLQGLLVRDPATIPSNLSFASPLIERFHAIAHAAGLTPLEAAFMFASVRSRADHIVFGVETVTQLQEAVSIVANATDAPWMTTVENEFQDIGNAILNPGLWGKIVA